MGSSIEVEKVGTAGRDRAGTAHKRGTRHHNRGLLAIGLYKLVEAVLFVLVGLGAIHFIHRDLGGSALRLVTRMRVDPDGRLVSWVLVHLNLVTSTRLKQIGVGTFFYAALRLAEGAGLVMEKAWGEYLTVGVTIAFLPWELYEIARHMDWIRVCLLVANLVVLAYLLWWLRRSKREKLRRAESRYR